MNFIFLILISGFLLTEYSFERFNKTSFSELDSLPNLRSLDISSKISINLPNLLILVSNFISPIKVKFYSKYKKEWTKKYKVDIVNIDNVTPEDKPGLVTIKNGKVVKIKPVFNFDPTIYNYDIEKK